ncbi:hypothetical protein MJC1_03659 [Methylocystis sp. MJC1]|nr:hypothetical protein MJC1_03659 [Methylocystis sp. MJC1]
MRGLAKTCTLAAACIVAGVAGPAPQARAGVMSIPRAEIVGATSSVEQVHYRYWRHHYYHRHWRYGYWRPYRHYRYYGYYPAYNPAGALAGAAVGLATAPLWALGGWGSPYYW